MLHEIHDVSRQMFKKNSIISLRSDIRVNAEMTFSLHILLPPRNDAQICFLLRHINIINRHINIPILTLDMV